MLIGFEASALQGCKSGVGYYTENMMSSMMKVAPEHSYVLFANRDIRLTWQQLGTEKVYDRHFFPVRAVWMQAALPVALKAVSPDICHFTNYLAPLICHCPYVVTIYDMTVFVTPRYHNLKKLVLDRTLIPGVARRANAIITVSNSARHDILRYLHVPASKVHVIMGGVSPCFRPVTDRATLEAVAVQYGLRRPFFLYVGTIEPRKNLCRLVQAFGKVRGAGLPHQLVIVGQTGWHFNPVFEEVRRLGLTNDVIFTGYVPLEHLPALYSMAEVMAFPSLYEGFGLPVLEAMACGTPVLTSRSSSLVEVAGDAALLVDPLSVDEIAAGLCYLHQHPDHADELRRRGIRHASRFTWEATARATLNVYHRVTSTRAVGPARRHKGA